MEIFGKNVRKARIAQGLSQSELARRVGVHAPRISLIENSEHDCLIGTGARIAAALGYEFSDMLKEDFQAEPIAVPA